MSDWKNIIPLIINKSKFQLYNSNCNSLSKVWNKTQNINLIKKIQLEKTWRNIGIFLTTQEFNCILRNLKNENDLYNFDEFILWLRDTISDKRLIAIKETFNYLNVNNNQKLKIDHILSCFNAEKHPIVRTRQIPKEEVENDLINVLTSKSNDGVHITEFEFLDYYVDISAILPKEKENEFIDILESCWNFKINSNDIYKEKIKKFVSEIINKISQKSNCKEDEYISSLKYFKFYDSNNVDALTFNDFQKSIVNLGLIYDQTYLSMLFNYFSDNSPKLFINCISDKINKHLVSKENVNPHYSNINHNFNTVIKKVRTLLKQLGLYSLYNLKANLNYNDENGFISRDNLIWRFNQLEINLSSQDFDVLFRIYDKSFSNKVDYQELLKCISFSHLNINTNEDFENLNNLISEAFDSLNKENLSVKIYLDSFNEEFFKNIGWDLNYIKEFFEKILSKDSFNKCNFLKFYYNIMFYFESIDELSCYIKNHLKL